MLVHFLFQHLFNLISKVTQKLGIIPQLYWRKLSLNVITEFYIWYIVVWLVYLQLVFGKGSVAISSSQKENGDHLFRSRTFLYIKQILCLFPHI